MWTMLSLRIALVLTMMLAVASGCSGKHNARTTRVADPPLIVPWNRVGDISLGEPKRRVEREYGLAGHGYHLLVANQGIVQGYYRLHGDRVYVEFQDGRVNEIGFSTRYYRTKRGFGVGSRIPFGPCYRTAAKRCEHRWHGLIWNAWVKEKPCHCWVKVGKGPRSLRATVDNFEKPWFVIDAHRGRVTGFYFALKFVD
jgi:hypothetical protein